VTGPFSLRVTKAGHKQFPGCTDQGTEQKRTTHKISWKMDIYCLLIQIGLPNSGTSQCATRVLYGPLRTLQRWSANPVIQRWPKGGLGGPYKFVRRVLWQPGAELWWRRGSPPPWLVRGSTRWCGAGGSAKFRELRTEEEAEIKPDRTSFGHPFFCYCTLRISIIYVIVDSSVKFVLWRVAVSFCKYRRAPRLSPSRNIIVFPLPQVFDTTDTTFFGLLR
jgi:hypothetical protein